MMCQDDPKEYASFYPLNKYERSNALYTRQILPHVNFPFPKIEKLAYRTPFSVDWKRP
jgi:hypothetical protein